MAYYLEVINGPVSEYCGTKYRLIWDRTIIGCNKNKAGIYLPNTEPIHALIYQISGSFKIEQGNGSVLVDGESIKGLNKLETGNTLQIGDWRLIVTEQANLYLRLEEKKGDYEYCIKEKFSLSSLKYSNEPILADNLLGCAHSFIKFCDCFLNNFNIYTRSIGCVLFNKNKDIAINGEKIYVPIEEFTSNQHFLNEQEAGILHYESEKVNNYYYYFPLSNQYYILAVYNTRDGENFIKKSMIVASSFLRFQFQPVFEQLLQKEKELLDAWEVQLCLVPQQSPLGHEIDLQAYYKPAGFLSGDYYDYACDQNKKYLYFCVGDVSGKGIRAGLVMATARGYFRLISERGESPLVIAEKLRKDINGINETIKQRKFNNMYFMSAIIGRWDQEQKILEYIIAGDCNYWLYSQEQGLIGRESIDTSKFPPLGLALNRKYQLQKRKLLSGEYFIMATDGAKDLLEENLEKLEQVLKDSIANSACSTLENIKRKLEGVMSKTIQPDDITIMIACRK